MIVCDQSVNKYQYQQQLVQEEKEEEEKEEKEMEEEDDDEDDDDDEKNMEEEKEMEVEEKEEEKEEETSLKEDLNKKTVPQLKELLNTDDFLPFKEEWKSLTKKDDIINYILKKVEEDEKM